MAITNDVYRLVNDVRKLLTHVVMVSEKNVGYKIT